MSSMFSQILSRFRGRRRCVGVDLGASAIKIVRFDLEHDRPKRVIAESCPTPRGAFENYHVADTAAVGAALRDLLNRSHCRDYPVAVALPAPAVLVKRIAVPKSEVGSIAARVRGEIANLSPERERDLAFDFQVTGAVTHDKVEVLIAGARRDLVESYGRAVSEARAHLAVLDLDYFAIQNVVEWHPQPPTRGVALLLHAGFRYSAMNVVIGERSVFTAAIELGAKNLESATAAKPDDDAASQFIAGLCDDVHHTLNFYCSFLRERPIETILLSGGLAHLEGLQQALVHRLGGSIRVMTPLPSEDSAPWGQAGEPEFALAAGLATRAPRD